MPNTIKYSTTGDTQSLRSNDFYFGVGDVAKGPSDLTDHYNGIETPISGYTIYVNTTGNLTSIFCANNDNELIKFTNGFSGQNFTGSTQCLNWYNTQTNYTCVNKNYEPIVTDGLVLNMDAGFTPSYSSSGVSWYDLSYNNYTGTLINGPTFNPSNGGSIVFDGVDDTTTFGDILDLGTNNATINIWLKINSSWLSGFRCPLSKALFGAQNFRYAILFNPNRQLSVFLQGNSGADIVPSTNASLNLNQWYMCTAIINRTSIVQLYIDGVLQTVSGNNVISQWNGLNFQSINPFRIGSYTLSDNITPNLNFPGDISIVQMYFRILNQQEILQNYNATKGRFGL